MPSSPSLGIAPASRTVVAMTPPGPGTGHDGGKVVFEGTPSDLAAARSTLTGEHLAAYVSG